MRFDTGFDGNVAVFEAGSLRAVDPLELDDHYTYDRMKQYLLNH